MIMSLTKERVEENNFQTIFCYRSGRTFEINFSA